MNSTTDIYSDILRKYWGYDEFRGIQREIIESIGSGKDTLGLMPTGGGKSVTFQVPALASEGVCVVITPLIALMKDQVANLRRKSILAAAIYSGMTHNEILTTLENCIYGGVKILYVSPERLSSELFQVKFKHMDVSFITVDEAHCISQWGYDFRPSYLKIADIRRLKPEVPILALTATATPEVVDDIQDRLCFEHKNVFRMSFERKNIAYIVRDTTDKAGELVHILQSVEGSAIVYARSRKSTKEIAEHLNKHHLNATFYHAGLDSAVKDKRQNDWQSDATRIIVATNAFGMGIDKADVRTVIHIDCPDSIEAYFQEAGRAGRDGNKSYAVLLYDNSDKRKLEKRIADTFPDKEYVRTVYDHIAYFFQIALGSGYGTTKEFSIEKFCHYFKHFPIQVDSALRILQRAGYLEYETDPDTNARVMFLLSRNELDKLQYTTPNETKVITAMLRAYGGLFTSYCYIDESYIAQKAGLDTRQTYLVLKALSQRKIISFIPKRKSPYITYTQRRVEGKDISIPPDAYEERKEQYRARINAIIRYATNNDMCRSRMLLTYFGEKDAKDCGHCDVCISYNSGYISKEKQEQAKELIMEMLKDRKKHHITELNRLRIERNTLNAVLEYLVNEEIILVDSCWLLSK